MLIVAVIVPIKPGTYAQAVPVMEKMALETKKEPGCVFYEFYAHISDQNSLLVYEEWESEEALEFHVKTPHMAAYILGMKDLLNGSMSARRHLVPKEII